MNRPILIVVIGYIIGIIWGLYLRFSIVPFYLFLISIYIIIRLPFQKKKFKIFSIKRYFRYLKIIFKTNTILIIIISSFISNTIIKYQESKYENTFQDAQKIELVGIVISNLEEKDYYNRYKINISEGKYKNINLYINVNKKQKLEYGDKIYFQGEFQEPNVATNYKGFDYKQYLKTQKIYGTVKISKLNIVEKDCINKFMIFSNNLSLSIKNNIQKTYNSKLSGIITGVMLGDTGNIEEEIKEDFSTSNISHVLAVSGMHISYIILLISKTTKKIFGKKISKIIASLILFLYMFITGFSVSVVRASIMGILGCMSFVFYRRSDTLNNISISCLIILINNPYVLTGMSFLLTYGGTLGIIYFQPTVEKMFNNIKIRNRKWKYIYLKIQRKSKKLVEMISVSISAQTVIAPIIILKLNTIGLGFLITNLLLSFVIGFIVIGGFVQILGSFISIKIGTAFAKIVEIPTYMLLLISKIDIGNFNVVTPDFFSIVLYYFGIIIFFYIYKIFHLKNCNVTQIRIKNSIYVAKYKLYPYFKKILAIIMCLLIVIIFISKIPSDLKIYFVDVGQGDCTLIVTPTNKKILIDGGGNANYDVGKNTLIPYLLDRKIKKLDYIIVTHQDLDHVRTEF